MTLSKISIYIEKIQKSNTESAIFTKLHYT